MDDLEERLNSHAEAFEGLMSLIPAKHYYGEDTSDQWQRKKQTKEQKRAAKKAKLDPASHKSAQDVMEENERKRKRELEGEQVSDLDVPGKEKPLEGLKTNAAKKQKLEQPGEKTEAEKAEDDEAARKHVKAEKRRLKREQKKEKQEKQKQKAEAKKALKTGLSIPKDTPSGKVQREDDEEDEADEIIPANEIDHVDVSGLVDEPKPNVSNAIPQSTASPSPTPESPASAIPSTSSTSSIVPPISTEPEKPVAQAEKAGTETPRSERSAKLKLPNIDPEVLKARLQAKIEALRAIRKADGIDGKPARNRQELIEARRRKAEQRKAHKKELRAKAKEDEDRMNAEAELARLRGSGSPLTGSDIFSPRTEVDTNFSFSRITFDDGQAVDSSLSSLLDPRRRKGPQDPRGALQAAQKKQARINGLDEVKRAQIEEKDSWLNAKKKAHGEKVRDNTSLLKKTLKRKEKAKAKSEKEWTERIEGVNKGQETRQKKREQNLRNRREEKGNKGKAKPKGKPAKKKGRPGFEGSFRGKTK